MASSTVKGGSDQPPKAGAGAQPGGSTAKPPAGAAASAQGASETKENFDSLVDIMGASGVDLRAEEEAIQQRDLLDHSTTNAAEAQHDQDGELYLQVYPLAFKVHTIAQKHGLGVDAAVLNYLSLAARTRFRNMLEAMIASSRHRSWSSHQHPPPLYEGDERRPMYHEAIVSDPRKQLALLEKAERGEEARRRRERLARDEEAAALASGGSGAAGEGGGDGVQGGLAG
ncbi:uncharacterized protein PFL1_06650 [Pseudozyma flocculosa PF-1]|uniref:Transcription initiation factor TFIID subunit 4 n=1 Tax=Pseudozyma flocculosa PF-1 TaxID=1277687 RepID=A0A061H0S8_9BASI|nr:uncharacterized protein PFL1_06650 [Pseudozyma flocculosa PF-1]EPQ25783.1 hypothetical protein PFL1_06650 [Pseudozyma flocculosa PF-1]